MENQTDVFIKDAECQKSYEQGYAAGVRYAYEDAFRRLSEVMMTQNELLAEALKGVISK